MKPLLKVDYVKMPLTLPSSWRDFFQEYAHRLGLSRNGALCMALKFGGPILEQYFKAMRAGLEREVERIKRLGQVPSDSEFPEWYPETDSYEKLGAAGVGNCPAPAVSAVHEDRRTERTERETSGEAPGPVTPTGHREDAKPQGGKTGHRDHGKAQDSAHSATKGRSKGRAGNSGNSGKGSGN